MECGGRDWTSDCWIDARSQSRERVVGAHGDWLFDSNLTFQIRIKESSAKLSELSFCLNQGSFAIEESDSQVISGFTHA